MPPPRRPSFGPQTLGDWERESDESDDSRSRGIRLIEGSVNLVGTDSIMDRVVGKRARGARPKVGARGCASPLDRAPSRNQRTSRTMSPTLDFCWGARGCAREGALGARVGEGG